MTQALYAHMNNKEKKIKKEMFCRHQVGPFDLLHILDLGYLY
jgi:hypothetical protein